MSAPKSRLSRRLAMLVALLALTVGGLAAWGYESRAAGGKAVSITFSDARGVRPGNPVRFRGVDVGQVRSVTLRADAPAVEVRASLAPPYAAYARNGTRFWVVRPSASIVDGLTGLDTIAGDNYLALDPSSAGPPCVEFMGLEGPAAPAAPEGSLRIELQAKKRSLAVRVGNSLNCCGITVGAVTAMELLPDGAGVRAEAWVGPAHRHLVRANSTFTEPGSGMLGINLASLDGINFDPGPPSSPPAEEGRAFRIEIK